MKKVLILICLVAVSFVFLNPIYAAQGGKGAAPQIPAKRPVPADRAIAFLAGSISKIDTTVPTNVKIELISEADNKIHIIEVNAATNILKTIDAAELKTGEKAKVVLKKTGNKEVALSVLTQSRGSLKK